MEKDFKIICKKDIDEIITIINEYLPSLEKWHLEQSAIFEENKRIICKSIKDRNNIKIGYDIRIHINGDQNVFVHFRYTNNSIFLIKKMWIDKNHITLNMNVSLINNEIIRKISIKDENGNSSYDESYDVDCINDLQSYFDSESLSEIIINLKEKSKIRKRC